jgi:hypothetical protein
MIFIIQLYFHTLLFSGTSVPRGPRRVLVSE